MVDARRKYENESAIRRFHRNKQIQEQRKIINALTDRLCTCDMDEFLVVQKELFKQQEVLKQLKAN